MESCCYSRVSSCKRKPPVKLTATSIRSRPTSSMVLMTFFSILTSWVSFFARSGPNAPAAFLRNAWPEYCQLFLSFRKCFILYIPKLAFPKSLPPFVEDIGGGGVSIWEAVGARDWRIEYVRCILSGWVLILWENCSKWDVEIVVQEIPSQHNVSTDNVYTVVRMRSGEVNENEGRSCFGAYVE